MNGIDCFLEGFSLVRRPGLRQYVIVPALINAVVLILMVSGSYMQFDGWVASATGWLPDWLSFLSGIVWFLAVIAVIFALFYIFTIVANIVASPFNALLSIKVEATIFASLIVATWLTL